MARPDTLRSSSQNRSLWVPRHDLKVCGKACFPGCTNGVRKGTFWKALVLLEIYLERSLWDPSFSTFLVFLVHEVITFLYHVLLPHTRDPKK